MDRAGIQVSESAVFRSGDVGFHYDRTSESVLRFSQSIDQARELESFISERLNQ